jgi:hypothetical protein
MPAERVVGRIDLGHPGRGGARGGGVTGRNVGVIGAGQPAPGRLDSRHPGAALDPEDVVGLSLGHP